MPPIVVVVSLLALLVHLTHKELTQKELPKEDDVSLESSSTLERAQTRKLFRGSRYVVTLDILRFFSCLALVIMTLYGILRDTNPTVSVWLQWPIFATYVSTDLFPQLVSIN